MSLIPTRRSTAIAILAFALLFELRTDLAAQCPPASISVGFHNQHVGAALACDGDTAIFGQVAGYSAPIHARKVSEEWERIGFVTSQSLQRVANGLNVALNGRVAVSADPLDIPNRGTVSIAELSGSTWTTILTIGNPGTSTSFGSSIAIANDGTLVAVGASGESGDRGAVYVFRRNPSTWVLEARLSPKLGSAALDLFGFAVAFDGGRVLVGAPGENSSAGAIYVFDRSGTSWTEQQRFTAKTPAPGEAFGAAIDVDGQRLVATTVQGILEFSRAGSSWSELGFVTRSRARNMALSGARLAVGTAGRAEVFEAGPSGWSKIASFGYPAGFETWSNFGQTVALTTRGLLVGASGWDNDPFQYPHQPGAVCYYDLSDYGKSLVACGHGILAQYGGAQRLRLDAPSQAGRAYLIVGSVTGRGPIVVDNVSIPLSFDFYLDFTAAFPNSAFLPRGAGVLDANGRAEADFVLPYQVSRLLSGVKLHHAFVTFGAAAITSASNAVTIEVGL